MSLSFHLQESQNSLPTTDYDAIVLGAGPYGLSVSAHLRAQGLKTATFGKPISLWREHMPEGMLLRSYWWATSLSDPQGAYSFARYFAEKGMQGIDPLPVEIFIDYGLWFQKHAIPDLDETYINNIRLVDKAEGADRRFAVTLADERVLRSRTVVMAPGLHYYRYVPPEYAHMPASLLSHSSDHSKMDTFAGKHVAIIGRGQAALETAALMHEQGTDVTLIARHELRWLRESNKKVPAWVRTIRAPQAGMGNGWLNVVLEKYPYMLQRMSRSTIDHMVDTTHGPAGSRWLRPRVLNKIAVHEQVEVQKVEESGEKARLSLSDGKTLEFDHVILGTGYRPDVKRLSMLDGTLQDAIQTYRGSPVLNTWFESSVPGLYFVGFSSARSFGPFYRFVIGTDAASHRVARALARQRQPMHV